ncbi:hypothetical protein CMI47_18930 [Candidatus Pacearchaeota archaeon]|nr:hypothetical protein [Candidatus Pacearchaeota archaeon]
MSDYNNIMKLIKESLVSMSDGTDAEYGSRNHVNDLQSMIAKLILVKNSLRKGPNRLKHRKEMHRIQDAIGALRYLSRVAEREGIKSGILKEGGLKAPHLTAHVKIDPETVKLTADVYKTVIDMWNKHMELAGMKPVRIVDTVGSSYYHTVDDPGSEYGDIDVSVSFPVGISSGAPPDEIRQAENQTKKDYVESLIGFLNQSVEIEKHVNTAATLRGSDKNPDSALLLILRLPNGDHIQADTIVTYPLYIKSDESDAEWMPWRWIPEQGKKGYTIGNLYTALGAYFNMSIGDRGVLAKTRDGEIVPFRQRKGTSLILVSKNIRTFLRDIAEEFAGSGFIENDLLTKYPGVDPKNITIANLATGIKGLALTLEDNDIISSSTDMLDEILELYTVGLKRNIDKKLNLGIDTEKYKGLEKLNDNVSNIVKEIFKISGER